MNFKVATAALIAGFIPSIALAEGGYIGIGGGKAFQDDSAITGSNSADEFSYETGVWGGLRFGWITSDWLHLEIEPNYSRSRLRSIETATGTTEAAGGSYKSSTLFVNGWLQTGKGEVVPYIGGGLGLSKVEIESVSSASFGPVSDDDIIVTGQFGAGLQFLFSSSIRAGLDYRYVLGLEPDFRGSTTERLKSDYKEHRAGLSLYYLWGDTGVAPAPVPLDTDGDGIPDRRDRCPTSAPGANVVADGCEPVALDTDGDGINDLEDRCPGTRRNESVNLHGCPLDTDQDGVADSSDQCPGTRKGSKVAANGCILVPGVFRTPVLFAMDSHEINASSRATLDQIALALRSEPTLRVRLSGHADSTGRNEYNIGLSYLRADAVRRYLLSKAVKASQVDVVGYGAKRPVSTNDSDAGRQQNRRVIIEVLTR